MMKRLACLALASVLPVCALAQTELIGKGKYPQFRSLSGLVGGGFGVDREGKPNFRGAMALSTPIGYTMSNGRAAFGLANTSSSSRRFEFFQNGRAVGNKSNGTAIAMASIGGPLGNFTGGYMTLSSVGDSVFNFQYSPPLKNSKVGLAVGVQDAFNAGGESGEKIDVPGQGGNSRSYFGVATFEPSPELFVSLGVGSRRFDGPFGNFSFPIIRGVRGMAEYDTFNWNFGAFGDLGGFKLGKHNDETTRYANATAFLGVVRGKFLTWGVNVAF